MRQTMLDGIPPVLCLAKRFIENLSKRELRDASLFLSCVFLCFIEPNVLHDKRGTWYECNKQWGTDHMNRS
jgi:hypothetical protein